MAFRLSSPIIFLSLALFFSQGQADAYFPNSLISQTEHVYTDAGGFNNVGFQFPLMPCDMISGGNTGRITAAVWVRFLFHDVITYDKNSGTGGLDGSLAFFEELNRDENKGDMEPFLARFSPFVNPAVSSKDPLF